jgi:uncharacterized protein
MGKTERMSNFTPLASTIGGILIGLSATTLLTLNGKIAGISGIFGGLVRPARGDVGWRWRALFMAGLLAGGVLSLWLRPGAIGPAPNLSLLPMIVAGLFVGAGTQLGSGCTSGHGVCGISRGSLRSIVATITFMTTGIATVYVVRHLLGIAS